MINERWFKNAKWEPNDCQNAKVGSQIFCVFQMDGIYNWLRVSLKARKNGGS